MYPDTAELPVSIVASVSLSASLTSHKTTDRACSATARSANSRPMPIAAR